MAEFTPGRYVIADTDHDGGRDPIALQQQVKNMRETMAEVLHRPVGLIVIVVQDDQRKEAVERIQAALDDRLNGGSS